MAQTSQARGLRSHTAIHSSSPIRATTNDETSTPLSPPQSGSTRPKKNASITPKRFARFFTPRSSLAGPSSETGRKRSAGEDIDESLLNSRSTKRRLFPDAKKPGTVIEQDEEVELPPCLPADELLKVEALVGVEPSSDVMDWHPVMSSPYMRHRKPVILEETDEDLEMMDLPLPVQPSPVYVQRETPVAPVRRFGNSNLNSRMLMRECGLMSRRSARSRTMPVPWHSSFISSMCSTASDVYHLNDLTPQQTTVVPFSMTTSLYHNTDHFTVIGDSTGCVQILQNEPGADPSVKCFWRAHDNAITAIDVAGPHLATASSDRSSRVIDFETGKTIINLAHHESALRNIKFRPSDPHVLMTSARDGTVNIWDIRHRAPASALDPQESSFYNVAETLTPRYPPANIRHSKPLHSILALPAKTSKMPNTTSRSSITSLQWLPGREHLFLSAGEVDATITLWDSRYISRQHLVPLARTALPTNDPHYRRDFGVTSLSVGSDGTRLYSTCRNSSVYAYSIPHLILGDAPELEIAETAKFTFRGQNKLGLGPLFSMRHPDLHIDSFWIKSSILPASISGTGDILAVGNTAIHPILFPVNEALISSQKSTSEASNSLFTPLDDKFAKWDSAKDGTPLPCMTNGVALRSGTDGRTSTETTAVAWQADGGLVTVDDESNVRFWGHDLEVAGEVRKAPNGDPVHFTHGFADVGAGLVEEVNGKMEGLVDNVEITVQQ